LTNLKVYLLFYINVVLLKHFIALPTPKLFKINIIVLFSQKYLTIKYCTIFVQDVQLKNFFVLQGRRRDSLVSFEEDLSTTASDQLCTANIADGGGHVRFVDSTVRSDIFLFKENDSTVRSDIFLFGENDSTVRSDIFLFEENY
jgi:hypothetical protein